jgi:hypothetical protein
MAPATDALRLVEAMLQEVLRLTGRVIAEKARLVRHNG